MAFLEGRNPDHSFFARHGRKRRDNGACGPISSLCHVRHYLVVTSIITWIWKPTVRQCCLWNSSVIWVYQEMPKLHWELQLLNNLQGQPQVEHHTVIQATKASITKNKASWSMNGDQPVQKPDMNLRRAPKLFNCSYWKSASLGRVKDGKSLEPEGLKIHSLVWSKAYCTLFRLQLQGRDLANTAWLAQSRNLHLSIISILMIPHPMLKEDIPQCFHVGVK